MSSSTKLVKLYYRIGEVARLVGEQPHVLRYWETEFRSVRPEKSAKGQRVYTQRDVERLRQIKDLLRNRGFTIPGARRQLREPGPVSAEERDVRQERDRMRSALLTIRGDLTSAIEQLEAEMVTPGGAAAARDRRPPARPISGEDDVARPRSAAEGSGARPSRASLAAAGNSAERGDAVVRISRGGGPGAHDRERGGDETTTDDAPRKRPR